MNFYSDKIINNIVDTEPLETIADSVDTFKLQCRYFLTKYSHRTINHGYTNWILNDPNIVVAFYCMDTEFDIANCPSMLVYRKVIIDNEVRYYVLFTCTKRKFRGQGYGSILLDNLQTRIREDHRDKSRTAKIILSSVEDAVLFYEAYGFRWTRQSIKEHPMLMWYEHYEEKKEYFIMELCVVRTK